MATTRWNRVAAGWLSLVLAGAAAAAPPATAEELIVYVSGYSPQIARYRFDAARGRLTALGTTPAAGNPSFLAMDEKRRFLYAVNEADDGQVAAFAIDPADGALQARGRVSSGGSTPAYVGIDHSGRWVMAANYGNGTVALLPVHADGSLGPALATPWVGANAHEIVADPTNRFVYVPCLGSGYVAELALDATSGALRPLAHTAVPPPQRGPRHLVFHPDGKHAYLIDETSSAMEAFAVDPARGQLSRLQVLSTRPAGATGFNKAAELAIDRGGHFLYGSNRGDDQIVIYALDGAGRMSLVGFQKSGGRWPRDFTIDPTGRWLLVANKRSDNVVVFAVDGQSGRLTETATFVAPPAPSFVEVVALPGR